MLCPQCNNEIIGNTAQCPDCGYALPVVDSSQKDDSKKIFTHYKILLLNPGPREGIFELLAEIAGMPVKQARQQATHTPWEVISRIPLNKAQEIKVLLETSRATVRLQGMDIWEDHEESDEHEEQDNSGASRNKFKKKLLLWCSIILLLCTHHGNYRLHN